MKNQSFSFKVPNKAKALRLRAVKQPLLQNSVLRPSPMQIFKIEFKFIL